MGKQHEMIAMDVQGFMFILACHQVCSHVRVHGSAHDRGCVVNGSSKSTSLSTVLSEDVLDALFSVSLLHVLRPHPDREGLVTFATFLDTDCSPV